MLGVAFHLGGPAFVAFDEDSVGDAVERRRAWRRIADAPESGLPAAARARHDVFVGLARAGRHAGQSASDAPISFRKLRRPCDRIFILAPADGLARELALQQVLELGRGRQIVQAAPVVAPASAFQPRPEGAPYRGQVGILCGSLIGGK